MCIDAWPSFVLIAPDGQVVGKASGEGIFDRQDVVIGALSDRYWMEDTLNLERITFTSPKGASAVGAAQNRNVLSFPGRIRASDDNLYLSDSNHHRILILSPDGKVQDIIGSMYQGNNDGPFNAASFFRPQGLSFDKNSNCLYIADTDNHLVRKADLVERKVTTIAGKGS